MVRLFPGSVPLRLFALVLGAAALATPASANCPRTGGTLCTAPGDQRQLSATRADYAFDLLGAVETTIYVAWTDLRDSSTTGPDIYLASVGACGDSTSAPGTLVCAEPGVQELPRLTTSGFPFGHPFPFTEGFGIIVAWQDGRGADLDIHARRMFGYPAAPWDDGTSVCTANGDQTEAVLAPYGFGGAIIAWIDRRSGGADVYAQCLDSVGTERWTANGVALCEAPGDQTDLAIVPDPAGGAYLFWRDERAEPAIYAIRIGIDGNPKAGWAPGGNRVSGSPAVPLEFHPTPGADQDVFVFWTDVRDDAGGDVYAQRVLGDGTFAPGWPTAGVPIATGPDLQSANDTEGDGIGGAYVLWVEQPDGGTAADADLLAQRVTATASVAPGWPAAGGVVCDAPGRQEQGRGALSDFDHGLMVLWADQRDGAEGTDLYALRLLPDGGVEQGWEPNGTRITLSPDVQHQPVMVGSWYGGARIAWVDYRDRATTGADVYGGGLSYNGRVSAPRRAGTGVTLGPAIPNPGSGRFGFALEIAAAAPVEVEIVDLAGRSVEVLARGTFAAGRRTLSWDGRDRDGNPVAAGVYFVRARIGGETLARRFVVLR